MLSPCELLTDCGQLALLTHKPSQKAVCHMLSILEHMVEHELEASKLLCIEDGFKIVWADGFNVGHKIEIHCSNSGMVVGKATGTNPDTNKIWIVSDLSPTVEGNLLLTLDETLEYIRHFIWANHDV